MERIGVTSVSPGHLKISEITKDLINFGKVIDEKYSQIDFSFFFNFVIGYKTTAYTPDMQQYEDDDIKYYAKEKRLGMDIVMLYDEFEPYKQNISMQRRIIGKYFFNLFSVCIKKYRKRLPVLNLIGMELLEDMRLFLIENLLLPDENGQYKLSIIETEPYERSIELFGNPNEKRFADNEQGVKVQDLTWIIDDAKSELSAAYLLIDKKWQLQKYQVKIKEVANKPGQHLNSVPR